MSEPSVMAFKGATSQTGIATNTEFPGCPQAPGEPGFREIDEALHSGSALAVLPMWNSHEGEITKLKALDLLFTRAARLLRLWPISIKFECLGRGVPTHARLNSIVSVGVAATQCSVFVEERADRFIEADSTVDAYRQFREDEQINAALCAPGQNVDGFVVLSRDTANPLNFTSFALLGSLDSKNWLPGGWGSWEAQLFPARGVFFGVEMLLTTVSLPQDQQQLLDDLTSDAEDIDDIPKVLFVSRRREDSCALLLEGKRLGIHEDVATDDGYSSKITVFPEIGEYNKRYSERAYDYLAQEHAEVLQAEFVRHVGKQTCFFACPALHLITHGFEQTVVEPVVRRIVAKYFELYLNGLACSGEEREFFERHKAAYLEQGPEFIAFEDAK